MKKFISLGTPILCIALFFIACKGGTKQSSAADSAAKVTPAHNDAADTLRKIGIIRALKDLRSIITSGDKDQIAGIFGFPVPDSVFHPSVDDSAFRDAYEKNNYTLTSAMFDQHHKKIIDGMELDNVAAIFKNLDIEQLRTKNKLYRDDIKKTEPIYHYWEIERKGDTVYLTWGTNSNKDYVAKKGEDDEDSSYGEYASWWTFVFDGRRLRLIRHDAAG